MSAIRFTVYFVLTLPVFCGACAESPSDGGVAGIKAHDFGERVTESRLDVAHVFELTNTSSRPLHILKVTTTCGCTVGEVSSKDVAAGYQFEVKATMTLSQAGPRHERINIICDGREPIVLDLLATTRSLNAFYCDKQSVCVGREKNSRITVIQLVDGDSEPSAPNIKVPIGVTVELNKWRLAYAASRTPKRPSRWQAIVELNWDGRSSVDGQVMIISDESGRSERIVLHDP